jgi:transposase-like protein
MDAPRYADIFGAMDARNRLSSGDPFDLLAALRTIREACHADGDRCCPHCECRRVQGWGVRGGRRRYRCTACGRTFSEFTGTILAHNKRIDRVAAYCQALSRGLTVRAAAAECGIHRTTSFRWRHRLLAQLRTAAPPSPVGVAETTEIRFLHSQKGSRTLERAPYRRGGRGFAPDRRRHWVLLVRDRFGISLAQATGVRPPLPSQLDAMLAPPAAGLTEMIAAAGPFSPYALFCRKHGIVYRTATPWRPAPQAVDTSNARAAARRLLIWIARFRGVASRYLDNYLRWHALVDHANRSPTESVLAPACSRRRRPSSRPPARPPAARTERDGVGRRRLRWQLWKKRRPPTEGGADA